MTSDAKGPRGAPPDLPHGALRVVALGGIKEIGRNMTMFEFEGRLLVVDCGMLLGKTNSPGVDLTLPDWSAFADRLDRIDAVVLTHGHEDHIGALPYLLRERRDIQVVADVILKTEGRIIVACFASHVHRVQQVLDAAAACERQVAFVGRSMVRNMQIARELGLLRVPDNLIVDLKQIDELPSRRILLISTGSQG